MVDLDMRPGCPRCYLRTGETFGQDWCPECEEWFCPRCCDATCPFCGGPGACAQEDEAAETRAEQRKAEREEARDEAVEWGGVNFP